MAINPIDLNHAMTRTQDYATLKHNEDNKTFVDQTNFTNKLSKEVSDLMNQVRKKDDVQNNEQKFDAKEKGSNEYQDNRKNQNKKGEELDSDGKVIVKKMSHFDVQI